MLTATRLVGPDARAAMTGESDSWTNARDRYRRLVGLGQERGERTAAVYCLFGLTQMLTRQGRHTEALAFAQYALDWFGTIDDRAGAAFALNQIGRCQLRLGSPRQAATYCERALTLCRELGDRIGEASAAAALGQAMHQCGEYIQAAQWCALAAATSDEVGDRDGRVEALVHLGEAHHALGHVDGARTTWRTALALLDGPDHPRSAAIRDKLRAVETVPAHG